MTMIARMIESEPRSVPCIARASMAARDGRHERTCHDTAWRIGPYALAITPGVATPFALHSSRLYL